MTETSQGRITQADLSAAVAGIRTHLQKAYDYGTRMFYVPDNHRERYEDDLAECYLLQAWRGLLDVLQLGTHRFLFREAMEDYQACKKSPLDTAMGPEEPYLKWGGRAWEYVEHLSSLYESPSPASDPRQASSTPLLTILERSEKYVVHPSLFGWHPCEEADVHDRIEGLLECVFLDVKRKPVLNKPIKNFEADTGIPSLQTLIDYKFIASTGDAKRIVDEVLADVGGYQGPDYGHLVFVLYETGRFQHLEDWKQMLEQSHPPSPTEVVLLHGVAASTAERRGAAAHRERMSSIKQNAFAKKMRHGPTDRQQAHREARRGQREGK